MPAWQEHSAGDGVVEHTLDAGRMGARIVVDVAIRRTVLSVALLVDGTDEATVDRCKRRAEELLVAGQKAPR
jgi:hypothetical protein